MEEKEQETREFQNYINDIKSQLQIPFIQRRIEEGKIKEDQQEEIQELIKEIQSKEEQLTDLSDLGSYLIEKTQENDQLYEKKIQQLENQADDYVLEIEFQKQAVNQYKIIYNETLQKLDSLQEQVQIMEEQADKDKFKYMEKESIIKERTQSIQEESQQERENNMLLIAENFQIKEQLKENNQNLAKMKQELKDLESQNRKFREDIEKQNKDLFDMSNKLKQLSRKLDDKDQQLIDQQKANYEQSQQIENFEKIIRDLKNFQQNQLYTSQNLIERQAKKTDSKTHQIQADENVNTEENQEQNFKENYGNLLAEIQELPDQQKGSFIENQINFGDGFENKNSHRLSNEGEPQILNNSNGNIQQEQNQQQVNNEPQSQQNNDKTNDNGNEQEKQETQEQTSSIKKKQNLQIVINDSLNTSQELKDTVLNNNNNSNQNSQVKPSPQGQNNQLKTSSIIERTYLDISAKRPTTATHQKSKQLHDLLQRKKQNKFSLAQNDLTNNNINEQENLIENVDYNQLTNSQQQIQQQKQKQQQEKKVAKRREPYEEFFHLTGQCVKLNSQYMDDILAIDISGYYQVVRSKGIPYHKWYNFIEKKLIYQRKLMLVNENQDCDLKELDKLKQEIDSFAEY